MTDYPKRGHGTRHFKCAMYSACLDIASAERWEDFYCDECPEFQEAKKGKMMRQTSTEGKGSKLCEECGERPTISPGARLCASCMARRSHKKKAAKKKTGKTLSKRTPRTGVEDYMDRTEAGADPVVTIHFDQHKKILGEIERLAEEETRTLELQILHLLKQSLNPSQKGIDTH